MRKEELEEKKQVVSYDWLIETRAAPEKKVTVQCQNGSQYNFDCSGRSGFFLANRALSREERQESIQADEKKMDRYGVSGLGSCGWKFHIGIRDGRGHGENMKRAWEIVSNILIRHKVNSFKIGVPEAHFSDPGENHAQAGKQITIYNFSGPKSDDPVFWGKICQEIEYELMMAGIEPEPTPCGENEYSITGSAYFRFRCDAALYNEAGIVTMEGLKRMTSEQKSQVVMKYSSTPHPNPSQFENPYQEISVTPVYRKVLDQLQSELKQYEGGGFLSFWRSSSPAQESAKRILMFLKTIKSGDEAFRKWPEVIQVLTAEKRRPALSAKALSDYTSFLNEWIDKLTNVRPHQEGAEYKEGFHLK